MSQDLYISCRWNDRACLHDGSFPAPRRLEGDAMHWRAILDPTRLVRVSALTVLVSTWGPARGAEVAPEASPAAERNAGPADTDGAAAPRVEVSETEIHTDPPPCPGARLGLEAGRKFQGMRYHWFQVEGPTVEI